MLLDVGLNWDLRSPPPKQSVPALPFFLIPLDSKPLVLTMENNVHMTTSMDATILFKASATAIFFLWRLKPLSVSLRDSSSLLSSAYLS